MYLRLSIVSCILLGLAAGPAMAASFNCAKAAKPDEIAVCSDPGLGDLDVKMATLFGVRMEIPMMMGAKGAAQDEQRAFLDQRGGCGGNIACIGEAYRERIAVLNQEISAAMQDYCVKMGLC